MSNQSHAFTPQVIHIEATIPSGDSVTGGIDIGSLSLVAIHQPATTTSANINVEASTAVDGSFDDILTPDGSNVTFAVNAGQMQAVNPVHTAGAKFIRIKGDASEGADRTFTLACKGI